MGAQTVNAFCGVVGWGSNQLIQLRTDPLPLVIAALLVFGLASVLLARTDWTRVRPLPVARRRRAGQIIVSAPLLVRSRPIPFIQIALVYIPVALAIGLIVVLLQLIPTVGSLVDGDRGLGVVSVILTLVVGGVGYAIGFVLVTAAVATVVHGMEGGVEVSAAEALRRTLARIGDLTGVIARTVVIVGVLLVSVVGIPWGIRQLVRYQFIAPVTMLEGLSGRAALDRSSELIRGRWLHTAVIVVALNALVGVIAVTVGLVLLVLLTGIPLWLFSILVSASSAVIVCYSAASFVLLYGDARAQLEELEPAEPLDPAAVRPRAARSTP